MSVGPLSPCRCCSHPRHSRSLFAAACGRTPISTPITPAEPSASHRRKSPTLSAFREATACSSGRWEAAYRCTPTNPIGGEFELIDFGRGHFGPNGDVARASTHDLAAAAFIVGYLPLAKRRLDLFAKIGAAVYRSNYEFAGDFSNECIVNTNTGICTPLSQFPSSGAATATGFAYGAGIQFHIGHYAIRGEYERIASPAASENPPPNTTRASGLGLASFGVTYGF